MKGKRNFKRVKEQGKLYQSENFGVCVYKRDDDEISQFAFIISTKINKIAVKRNRVERAVKQGIRSNLFRVPKNYDMIFLAKGGIMKKLTEEIMREIDDFFKKRNFSK